MNFSRNCTLHSIQGVLKCILLDNFKMITSVVRFVYILEML